MKNKLFTLKYLTHLFPDFSKVIKKSIKNQGTRLQLPFCVRLYCIFTLQLEVCIRKQSRNTNQHIWYPTVLYWCQYTASRSLYGRKRNRAIQKVRLIKQILLLIYRLANFPRLATMFTLCIINLFH